MQRQGHRLAGQARRLFNHSIYKARNSALHPVAWVNWRATLATLTLLSAATLNACGGGGGSSDGKSSGSVSLTLTSDQVAFQEFNTIIIPSDPPTIAATISNGNQTYYGTVKSDNAAVTGTFQITGTTSANIKPSLDPSLLTSPVGAGQMTVEVCKDNVCGDIVTAKNIAYTYAIYNLEKNETSLVVAAGGAIQTATFAINPLPPASMSFTTSILTDSSWLSATIASGVVTVSVNPANLSSGAFYNGQVGVTGLGTTETIFVSVLAQ